MMPLVSLSSFVPNFYSRLTKEKVLNFGFGNELVCSVDMNNGDKNITNFIFDAFLCFLFFLYKSLTAIIILLLSSKFGYARASSIETWLAHCLLLKYYSKYSGGWG